MASFEGPLTLSGKWIRLVPLSLAHAPGLREAFRDPEVGRYLLYRPGDSLEEMQSLISRYLDWQRSGTVLPFTTVLRADDRPIGMTNYLHIDRENRSVEVGGTWLDSAYWRTPVNTECKYLLFRHAFEVEQVHRVSLQTHIQNERSRNAIARVGATQEAIFRDDKLLADGSFRTSVVFGLLVSEWPRVKAHLEAQLARPWNPRDPGRSGNPSSREGPAP